MQIKAFRAFRYDPDTVRDVGSCIAPPYDVINPQQQETLYQKSPYNIVRIIKGKSEPSDDQNENQYSRAAAFLSEWIEKGVLKQDSDQAIYGYVQDFQIAGISYQRYSFIALAKLEPFGEIVRPHEKTLNDPIADRLSLKKATEAGFGLIYLLYEDQGGIADKIIEEAARQKPTIDFQDDLGVRHRLFVIDKSENISAIEEMMSDKSCIIADGHHRYTTALNYLENCNPSAKYQMLAFSNTSHGGLVVLATHRLVANLDDYSLEQLLDGLGADFEISSFSFDSPNAKADAKQKMLSGLKTEFQANRNAFGIYCGPESFYTAVLKNKDAMAPIAPEMSDAWRSLDVAVLHKLILEKILGIDEKRLAKQANIQYVKDTSDAIDESIAAVDNGQKQVAFFMNPPKLEQMNKVADNGERMPQKSTFFFPKVYTGLTIHKF